MKINKKNMKPKMAAVTVAATVAISTLGMPMVAFASPPTIKTPTAVATPITGVKSVAAHKAAVTAGEILGLEVATGDAASLSQNNLQIFGTDYNQEPSAYLSNYISDLGTPKTVVVSSSYGPNQAEGTASESISLNTRADILLGIARNSSGYTYSDSLPIAGYTPSLLAYAVPKLSSQDNSYDEDSINATESSMTGLMYELASTAGTTGRYTSHGDSPADIAETYEHYVKDLQLYILSQVSTKKKVAIVQTNSTDSSKLNIYKFVPTNGQTTSRPAEYLKYTTTNVLDTSACSGLTVSSQGVATIDVSAISTYLSGLDYVIAMKPTSTSSIIDDTTRAALETAGYSSSNRKLIETSPDSAYGCYMNSVDNALGMAALNSMVYPNELPMNEVAAYFYSKLYHIEDEYVDDFVNANFYDLFDHDGRTSITGDDDITDDSNASTLVGNCATKMAQGYSYYLANAEDIQDDYPDISY